MSRADSNHRIAGNCTLAESHRDIGPLDARRGIKVCPVRRRQLAAAVVTAAIHRAQLRLLSPVMVMHRLTRAAGVRRRRGNRHPYRREHTHQQQSQQKSGGPAMHKGTKTHDPTLRLSTYGISIGQRESKRNHREMTEDGPPDPSSVRYTGLHRLTCLQYRLSGPKPPPALHLFLCPVP